MIKVQISAIRAGDRVARTRKAEPREVTETRAHAKRIWLTFADGTTAQPAPTTVWWLDAEAPADDEGRQADLAMGADPTDAPPSRRRRPAAPKADAKPKGDRVTFFDAAEQVLRAADGPMKARAIAEAAIPLVRPAPKAKKPDVYLIANMHVDAAAQDGGRFVKTAPGVFDVREINPRGAAKRPKRRSA